ncbi:hypothetical protein RM190_20150 [Paracoccus sp. CPCC 101403]|uniref:Uncharacterized protein n=1 Tax=Paracoccus broussonetiae TaxID=3075834 RepID=A0ABU3EIV9_9RHOB|nr:hypothetical protein [Paracoccus sp. CPCC 101403]MDT1064186.1 hypothetical protein [Paracoccus sp. CPCC 101403]
MTLCNFSDLTRNDGRWLNLWAAFDVTAEYLGTFTLDELRGKAAADGKWISAIQYRRAGQRIDDATLTITLNGLSRGGSPFDFTGFRISPVRNESDDPDCTRIEVCEPGEHRFWLVYGYHAEAQEWWIVHDCEAGEEGEVLARLVDLTGHLVEYRDGGKAYANTRLADLPVILADRIHDEIPRQDQPEARTDDFDNHPLIALRESILDALERRA